MNKILIIGNGFDLNLGLKTSYKDFLESPEFGDLVERGSDLASYLRRIQGYNKRIQGYNTEMLWVDVEYELKDYSVYWKNLNHLLDQYLKSDYSNLKVNVNIDKLSLFFDFVILKQGYKKNAAPEDGNRPIDSFTIHNIMSTNANYLSLFKSEFVALKNSLTVYLQRVEVELNEERYLTNAFKLLRYGTLPVYPNTPLEEKCSFNQIYTLNFTKILAGSHFTTASFSGDTDIFHMHGSCVKNNIVFGVEDDAVDRDFLFLTKSAHAAFGGVPDLSKAMVAASEIHIFGCSLGDTDNVHFQHPFSALSQRREQSDQEQRKIIFYVWGHEGYQNTLKRILFLTNGRMAEFKITNEVVFFDLKEEVLVNQEWINRGRF